MLDAVAETVLAWLGTWLVHSTVLLLLVFAVLHRRRRLSPATRVVLWRAALFGALVTATLPVAFDLPGVSLAPARSTATTSGAAIRAVAPAPTRAATARSEDPVAGLAAPPPAPHALDVPGAEAASLAARVPHPTRFDLSFGSWALLALGVIGAGRLGHALLHGARYRRRLRDRVPLVAPELSPLLSRLAAAAGLRHVPALTLSPTLQSPIALGIWRPEVCVPARALRALSPVQVEALLAHEVAHVARRDALWLSLERWTTALLFLQPLHALARRRIREETELACDAFAVSTSACPVALAECLTEVASWLPARRPRQLAPAMAHGPSLLARRVERLLAGPGVGRRVSGRARLGVLLLLISVGLLVPGFRSRPAEAALAAARLPTGEGPAALHAVPAEGPHQDDTALASALRALDLELAGLEGQLAALRGLATELDTSPEIQAAVRRFLDRSNQLMARREALRRSGPDGDDR